MNGFYKNDEFIQAARDALPGSPGERYLKARGFTGELIKAYNLGYDSEHGAISIPYPGKGYYISRSIRKNTHESGKYYKPSGQIEPLFDAGAADSEVAFYTEGQIDALSLIQAGAPRAIAIGGGGAGKLGKEKSLPGKGIIVADNDDPGKSMAASISEILKKKGIAALIVNPPEGFKDSNDILMKDPEKLAALVSEWMEIKPEPPEPEKEQRKAEESGRDALERFHRWSAPDKEGNRKPFEILDDEIAEEVIRTTEMFCLNGRLYFYDSGVFRQDADGAVFKSRIAGYIHNSLRNIKRINRVYDLLVSKLSIRKEYSDINNYPDSWIPFKNGMLDLKSLELHPHSPEYLAINQLPREWQREYKTADPVVEQFLAGMIPEPEDREMLLAFCGYCMTRSTVLQKFMILLGPGGLGKSELLSLLQNIVGEWNTSSLSLQEIGERFARAELLGKLVNICADIPSKAMDQIDALKKVTGEDTVKAEYKGGAIFFFRPYTKLIFSANRIPHSLDDRTDAFYRRLLIVPIRKRGAEIPDLRSRLRADADSFVHAAVEAASRVFNAGKLEESENSKAAVIELYKETDPIQAFLYDRTIRKPGGMIERGKLFSAYERYCTSEERPTTSRNGFYGSLREKGYSDRCSNGRRFFCGIDWKPADFEPAEDDDPFNG